MVGMSTFTISDYRSPRALLILALFLLAVIGIGALIGASNLPGGWYQELAKPPFDPPNWVFGPVWCVLYVLIAISGWRTFLASPRSLAMGFWAGQMLLNWLWSPIWFGLHLLWPAFAVIVMLLGCIIGYVATSWRRDRISALLFVPYGLWVAFAAALNLSVAVLN
jgi:tryptophan-rich sensory protein